MDTDLTAKFVQSCQNFDGGFGSRVGAESHAGLIYTCLGTLAITGHLHTCDQDRLGWWLAERQLPSGGLNGRPGNDSYQDPRFFLAPIGAQGVTMSVCLSSTSLEQSIFIFLGQRSIREHSEQQNQSHTVIQSHTVGAFKYCVLFYLGVFRL